MIRFAWYTIILSLSFAHLFSMEKNSGPKRDTLIQKVISLGTESLQGILNGLEMLYGVDEIDDECDFDVNSVGSPEDCRIPLPKKTRFFQK